jgi:hypothetical protein
LIKLSLNPGFVFESNSQKQKDMRLSVLILGAVMMTSVMTAQNSEPVKHRLNQADRMKSVVALNDQQYSKIKSIEEQYQQKHLELRKDTTNREQKRGSLENLRKERRKEIEAVLTPDQKSKWTAYKAEQKVQRKEQREAHHKKMEEEMRTKLSLTDDQQTKLREAQKEFKSQARSAKTSVKSPEENRAAMKSLREQHETKVKSILSADQYDKWKEIKKERRGEKNRRKFRGHRR